MRAAASLSNAVGKKSQIAFSGFLRYNKTIFRAGCDSPLAVKSATCESS